MKTLEARSKIGRFDTCNGNANFARAFPNGAYCLMHSKQDEHNIPDWCHSVRASPLWTTCSPMRDCSSAGTNVGPIDKVDGGVVNSAIALAAARDIQKSTGSGHRNELERGWSKSFMERMCFVMTKDSLRRKQRSCPQFGGAKGK